MGVLKPMKPGFLARTSVFDKDAVELVTKAVAAEGFSLIDIWDLCVATTPARTRSPDSIVSSWPTWTCRPASTTRAPGRSSLGLAGGLRAREVADEEGMCYLPSAKGLATIEHSDLARRTGILISGAAGQKIRSIATLLGRAPS